MRFDDRLTGGAGSFEFRGLHEVVEAHRLQDVIPQLGRVEAAVGGGLWAAGFVAYEAAPAFDDALVAKRPDDDPDGLPLLWFGLFEERVPAGDLRPGSYSVSEWRASESKRSYLGAIRRIKEYIRAGDTYQVNFTYRLNAAFRGDPWCLYGDLLAAQSASYCAYLDTGRFQVLSASPELFFARSGDRVVCKPMKGTAARGRWYEEDQAAAQRLTASAKERAENVMIVDLIRNDLGRIAEFGTVQVEQLFEAERYETVWQMVSTVSARLRPSTPTVDIFRALFPCGSVTGAPKVRTTEIIDELESTPRGVYCGAVGMLTPPGTEGPDAEFNVAIRTVEIDQVAAVSRYGVGGGVTHDSLANAEFEESRAKAQILLRRIPEFDLLETLRWEPGSGYLWLDRHLQRLSDSASYFGFVVDLRQVGKRLEAAVAGHGAPQRVRVTVGRGGDIGVETRQLPETGVVRLALDSEPVDSRESFLFHKTTHRAIYDRALERHPEADDVLLVNERGEVTESTIANVVVLLDGRWITPPLSAGCLPGIHRAVLIDQGAVVEETILAGELARAERIELVNSVRLRRPAVLVEE